MNEPNNISELLLSILLVGLEERREQRTRLLTNLGAKFTPKVIDVYEHLTLEEVTKINIWLES